MSLLTAKEGLGREHWNWKWFCTWVQPLAAASGVFRGSRSGEPGSECGSQGEADVVGEAGMHVNVRVWGFYLCSVTEESMH